MAKRIIIGELKQESNTFVRTLTTLQHFRDFHLWYGADLVENLRDTNTEVGGFLDVAAEQGWEVLPTLATFAISGGPVEGKTIRYLREELLAQIRQNLPCDGMLLALHGAMVADDDDDPDGETLAAVRQLLGPDVPLVVSLDLHANVTQKMVDNCDALVAFKTSPHVDQRDTGQRTARVLARWFETGIRPAMHMVKLPMVTPATLHIHNLPGPYMRLMEATRELERQGAISASLCTVQPWLDITEFGYASIVLHENHRAAIDAAQHLAQLAWDERAALTAIGLVPVDQAISQALAAPAGPIVLSDLADGTGAGSPGDATSVIAALLAANPDRKALVWIHDPEVAALAAEIGEGGAIDTLVGGKLDNVYNKPVRFVGTVEFAKPASYRFTGDAYTGISMDMGLSAVLRNGNVYLLVTSKSVMTVDPALYRAAGLEPRDAQIVVVKSHIQFRSGYTDIAKQIILLDTPGMSSDHLAQFTWKKVPRPLFPLDAQVTWPPQA